MGSTRFARVPDTAGPAAKFFSLQRLILICVITLAIIVVSSAGLIIYNLRDRVIAENEAALTNSALIIAKQIEQTFTGMEVCKGNSPKIFRAHRASTKRPSTASSAAMTFI